MMKDGLNQYDRSQRTTPLDAFEPLDGSMDVLLRQAKEIAAFIRYYNRDMKADGHFDAFLNELKQSHSFDGNMEPSQALLYAFINNLHKIIEGFNLKWKERFILWYINDVLGVKPKPVTPDSCRISFLPNVTETIIIPKGQRFTYSEAVADERIYYRLTENTEVNAVQVVKACLLYLEKNDVVYPANLFDMPVAIHKKDYFTSAKTPAGARRQSNTMQTVGLQISSPSFLLDSGKRRVTISFRSEKQSPVSFSQKRKIIQLMQAKKNSEPDLSRKEIRESIYINLLSQIFCLEISTGAGWETIAQYTVGFESRDLTVGFLLKENFPPTDACSPDIHETTTEYPALKILLNQNAWLYPYAWLSCFFIKKISIRTHVENTANLMLYNDLGLVDVSKPFSPFGINTERGAWFVVGNYEMAKKRLQSIDLKIEWLQLPDNENGLYSYYFDYHENINNKSFRVRPKYLSDYHWQHTNNTEDFFLFSTQVKDRNGQPEAKGRLVTEAIWKQIRIDDSPPVRTKREDYEYSSLTKNGFFRFELEEPNMGFGGKLYRHLYAQLLMSKKFRKNRKITLNEPLAPLANRITLSYFAFDEIDLRTCPATQEARLHHIYPFGEQQVYPKQNDRPIPFVHSLNHDFNVLFGLQGVEGGEVLNLYLELAPLRDDISLSNLPVMAWYWGDGYRWERLPDDSILRNTTQNLLTNGFLRLHIPTVPENGFRDADGLVWIMAGVLKNSQYVSPLVRLHCNVAQVVKDSIHPVDLKKIEKFTLNESEKEIPGVAEVYQVTPFNQRHELETAQQQIQRLSEYVTHRQRAVTKRDYERITLEVFPEIEKVKCLYDSDEKKVTLLVIPKYVEGMSYEQPCATPELLLEVEKYFRLHTSASVKEIDARSPIYEELIVRCEATLAWTNFSKAASRSMLTKAINKLIAPWQKEHKAPVLDDSFTLQDMHDRINLLKQVEEIRQLSVIHIYRDKSGRYFSKEYSALKDKIIPSTPYSIFVPCRKHLFVSGQQKYGLEEMNINENFII